MPSTTTSRRRDGRAAKALPRRRAWLTLRACRPAATVATKASGVGDYQSAVCGGHEQDADKVRKLFDLLDEDGNGELDLEETARLRA